MVVPHYTYLVLKMPGLKCIIIVKGNFELSDICDKEFHKMAQIFGMTTEYAGPKESVERNTSSNVGRSPPDKVFDATPMHRKFGFIHRTQTKLLQLSQVLLSLTCNLLIIKAFQLETLS
jgi:hypothetical protein